MSILNLGLQSVGLAHTRMEEDMEAVVQHCHSVAEIQRMANERENVCAALLDFTAPIKTLLSKITQ